MWASSRRGCCRGRGHYITFALTCAADITELNLPKRATIAFVDGKDKLLHFQITMRPEEGIYRWVTLVWRNATAHFACV